LARAIYIMCDGEYRKIGIAAKPSSRRVQLEASVGKPIQLLTAMFFEDGKAVAAMERRAHFFASEISGGPIRGREWFRITDQQAYEILERVAKESGHAEVETPHQKSVTEAQARAHRKYMASLIDRGYTTVTVRLSRRVRERLDLLAKSYGSRQKVIESLLSPD